MKENNISILESPFLHSFNHPPLSTYVFTCHLCSFEDSSHPKPTQHREYIFCIIFPEPF